MSAQAGPGPSTTAFKAQNQQQQLAPIGDDYGEAGDVDVADDQAPFTEAQLEEYREQDRYLPIANVGRIMKNALPGNAKIAKEAKECVQECVSEFISFLSSEAADKVLLDKRKTINGEDILYSMTALGFDNYMEAGKVYLAKYRNYIMDNPHRSSHSAANPNPTSTNPSHLPNIAPRPSTDTGTGFSSPMEDDGEVPDESPLMEMGVSPESMDEMGMGFFSGNGFLSFVEDQDEFGGEEGEEDEHAAGGKAGKKGKAGGNGGKRKAAATGTDGGGAGTKRKAGGGEDGQEAKKQKKGGGGGPAAGKKAGKK